MRKIIYLLIIKKIIVVLILMYASISHSQELILPTSLPNNNNNNDFNVLYSPSSEPQGLPPADDINVLLKTIQPNLITSALAYDTDNLQFNNIKISDLLTIIYSEVKNKNYVLSPQILNDTRRVSFRYIKKDNGSFDIFVREFLNNLDYDIKIVGNTEHIINLNDKNSEDYSYYVYENKFRSANYLTSILKEYFPQNFRANSKSIHSNQPIQSDNINPNSASALIDKQQDTITFRYENEKQKEKILSLLSSVDKQIDNVLVKAYIYEVHYSSKDASALSLVLSLINERLQINTANFTNPIDNIIGFTSNSFKLIFSQIDTDTRFKLISNPFLRVQNNKEARFNVGASVPVLGNVSYQEGGQAVQSIDYRDTGLTFSLTADIYKEDINIDLKTEISEVVNTTTGVNSSPTFTKRSLDTSFTTKLNNVVMLAGLTNNKNSNEESRPFFLPFFTSKVKSKENTEIIIFFEVLPSSFENSIPVF